MANFKARVRGLFGGSREWSYGFNFTANTDVATAATTLHDATQGFWNTATSGYAHLCSATTTTTDVTAYLCNASWRSTNKKRVAFAVAGDDAANSLAIATAVNIFMFSGVANDGSHRGHMKLPAPSNDALDGLVFSTAFVGHVSTRLEQFLTDMSALTAFTMVSYNRHTNKMGDPPFTIHALTDAEVSNKPGTNRQRNRKQIPTYGADEPIP